MYFLDWFAFPFFNGYRFNYLLSRPGGYAGELQRRYFDLDAFAPGECKRSSFFMTIICIPRPQPGSKNGRAVTGLEMENESEIRFIASLFLMKA